MNKSNMRRRDNVSSLFFFHKFFCSTRGKNYPITYASEILSLFLVKEEKDKDKCSEEQMFSFFFFSRSLSLAFYLSESK